MGIEREDVEGFKDSEIGKGTRTGPDEADELVVVACLGGTRTVHVGEQRQGHRVPACAVTSKAVKYARPRLRSLLKSGSLVYAISKQKACLLPLSSKEQTDLGQNLECQQALVG